MIMVGVNFVEVLSLGEQAESVAAVPYELLFAALGLLWATYIRAPENRSGWTVPPFLAVCAGFFLTWISMGLTNTGAVNWQFAQSNLMLFRVWLPDAIALFMLVWAVVEARKISLG